MHTKSVITAIMALSITTACAPRTTVPIHAPSVKLTTQMEEAAKKSVKSGLKDPMSAVFENLRAFQEGPDKIAVCGDVNAKNSFGGYVGARPFYTNIAKLQAKGGKASYTGTGTLVAPNDDSLGISMFYNYAPLCNPANW